MRYVIGCMTGTSMDGIDVALVAIEGHGLDMRIDVRKCASAAFDKQLKQQLQRIGNQEALSAAEFTEINHAFSAAHIPVITSCIQDTQIDLVAVHGQTVFHKAPFSWQMINPHVISKAVACTVVSDLRGADLAAGGQGAPMTPLADFVLFHAPGESRSIINLGGFCNITQLHGSDDTSKIHGFDLCACNHVLDHIARSTLDQAYDADGAIAASGQAHQECISALLKTFTALRQEQRSLGSGDELFHIIDAWSERLSPPDLANSACAAIAQCIAQACTNSTVLICAGGGVRNNCLMAYLNNEKKTITTDQFGIAAAYREAIEMAVLGALAEDKVPVTLTQITGASSAALAGTWTFAP